MNELDKAEARHISNEIKRLAKYYKLKKTMMDRKQLLTVELRARILCKRLEELRQR